MGGTLKLLGKSLRIVLDEIHFTVNLYSPSFYQTFRKTLPSPRKSFGSVLGRPTSKVSPLLDTLTIARSSRSAVFLVKGVLKIWSKLTGEHPCRSVISTIAGKIFQTFSVPFT